MTKKPKSAAARARKQAERYLTPITGAAGAIVGYRFAPGPHLRAKGARSQILREHQTNRFLSLDEAKLFRDNAGAAAEGGTASSPASPIPSRERRTLDALWALYEKTTRAAIEKNAALAPDRRDEDVIKPATLRFYRSMIKPWLAYAGDELAAALDAETIEAEYKAQKKRSGHATAHASYRSLLALLAFGKKIKWLAANEAKGLGLARPRGRLRLGLPEEIKALVDAGDALEELDTLSGASGREIADAIVAACWTGQRQQDLLACDLGRQLKDGFLQFARTHEGDFSQQKVRGRVEAAGGQANVKVLPPLMMRLRGRDAGRLIPAPGGGRWNEHTFRHAFAEVRAIAAKTCPSVADLQFRDLRDTAVTRLSLAGVAIDKISLWTGHSLKTIQQILEDHYLVATRESAEIAADSLEAWRKRTGVQW